MSDELDRSLEVDVLASMLQVDAGDSEDHLELLARKFELSLKQWTRVERKGGLFSKPKVQSVTVEVADTRYVVVREKHGVVARKTRIVRGVALSNKELPLLAWTEELAAAIKKLADSNAEAREALERFVMGG